jgi:signal transduction histidine kinase
VSFRARLFLAFAAGVLVPLIVFGLGVRREMTRRVTAQYAERVDALASAAESDLAATSARAGRAAAAIAADLAGSNQFRLAVNQPDSAGRRWLLDYAGGAMRAGALSLLRVEDSAGRILSSGHFRNEFDRIAADAAPLLASGAVTLLRVPAADGSLLTVARADSFRVSGKSFRVVAGIAVTSQSLATLAPDSALSLALITGTDTLGTPTGTALRRLAVPYVDAQSPAAAGSAELVISRRSDALDALLRGVNRWFAAALAVTVLIALVLAAWLSAQVGRPLTHLAEKTEALDLDRLDQDFSTDRPDEIGTLSRGLGAMSERLRTSAARLRDAERRATVGDVARQVNHDVKNGLAPIRHVLRHLTEVARDEPSKLASVFDERRGTLESSVDYLETLARNYAKLSPAADRARCDVNAIVRQVVRGAEARTAAIELRLDDRVPVIDADGVALRRILENLVGNAVDSLDQASGTVTLVTEPAPDGPPRVRITVADTGRGMSGDELARAFDDFYTTKDGGTGLGLSVVRRLVADMSGTLRVETEPGAGTRFIIELPAGGGAS